MRRGGTLGGASGGDGFIAMLLFGSASQVQARTTLGAFVTSQLRLDRSINGIKIDPKARAALMTEIWMADANQHLRRDSPEGARQHVPSGDSTEATLELLPEEWVYLPVMEVQSPGWSLRTLPVSTSDAGAACSNVGQWATENDYLLPPNGQAAASGEAQSIDADTLQGYLYNSLLRSGDAAEVAYFYAASPSATKVDAPPTTPAGGESQTNGQATPSWLLGFWHYIDRLKGEAATHSKQYDELHDLIADGKFVAAALDVLDRTLTVYERERKPEAAPTGFFDKIFVSIGESASPDHGAKLDIADFHAKIPPLRDKARQLLVDQPTYPVVAQFAASLDRLKAIEADAAFQSLYEQFSADRDKYPLTEQAFQMASAEFVMARVLDPQGGDGVIDGLLDAFLKGTAGDSPFAKEIAALFSGQLGKKAVDDSTAVAALTVGNAPGPACLWVALTKLGFLREIQKIQVAPKAPRRGFLVVLQDYVDRLVAASGVPEDTLRQWETSQPKSQTPSAQSKATAARVRAAEEVANRTQSGPRFMVYLGLVNLWAFYSGLSQANADTGALDVTGDYLSAGLAGTNLAADVVQFLASAEQAAPAVKGAALFGRTLTSAEAMSLYENLGKTLGNAAAIGGAVFGVIQIAQGIRDRDWTKKWQGTGSILISAGYWADVYVSRHAALLVAEDATVEVGAMAVGEGVLIGVGSALTFVGILVSIIAIAATHQSEVMAIAYALFTPGPRKFVDTIFDQMAKSKAVITGPDDMRSALADAKSSADSATFVIWPIRTAAQGELRGLGLGDDDLGLLQSIPVQPVVGPHG
jgi:hypothetical protein